MQRLTPGTLLPGIPASTWNTFSDTTKTVTQLERRTNKRGSRGASTLRVLVRNDTGDDITSDFPVLEIGSPIITTDDRASIIHEGIQFVGTTPDSDTKNFAIVQGPIPTGAFRPAIIVGPTWCQIDVTDEDHTYAKPKADNTQLESAHGGVKTLWKESGTGTKWAVVLLDTSDTFRLIRGQAVGASSDATLLVDNVVVLSGGLDPTTGNPATQVRVANIFSQSFSDNEYLDAVYSPGVSVSPDADWEALKTGSGTETYRLVRGLTVGAVAADATSFNIDNIVVLAGGLDPRAVAGDMAETLSITNSQQEAFVDNQPVNAIYFDTGFGTGWQTLVVERYRALRGVWYSGTTTLLVKAIVPLDSGLDPRDTPEDEDEIVEVLNPHGNTYTTGDKVYADYVATSDVWEARPQGGMPHRFAIVTATAAAAGNPAGGTITPGVGTCTLFTFGGALGSAATVGASVQFENYMLAAVAIHKPIFVFDRGGGK